MKFTIKNILVVLFSVVLLSSCSDSLDLQPEDSRQTADKVFEEPGAYESFLAKLYAGFALSGQQGPAGAPDLQGLDEGFSQYIRLLFEVQELTTDEAIIGWDDGSVRDLHAQVWTSGNEYTRTMYSRIMYQVSLTNEFLRQTTTDKLEARAVEESLKTDIQEFRYEARFIRALAYYHGLDIFGNMPFVTEEDPIGAFMPEQISRADLFNFVESELLAIESKIVAPRQNEYGRADQGAVWFLLAKLYLNAEVYTGQARYDDAVVYLDKLINTGGYSLVDDYQKLFLADNDRNGAQNEIIFPIRSNGMYSQTYGSTSFIIHAAIGGSMNPSDYGVNSGWAGFRTTPSFVDIFPNGELTQDQRAMFHTNGQSKEIHNVSSFTDGYAIGKYKNVDVNGNPGSDPTGNFVDTDFPLFRLADAYLMYAEATLRGGGGNTNLAVDLVNQLRERAYGDASHNITASALTLPFILDERGRELYWEAKRRTDLIRFEQFSTNGIWEFKGGVPAGTTTEAFRNIMPIPATDLSINTNLNQNPGY